MSQRSKELIAEDIKNSFNDSNLNLLGEFLLRIISDARFDNDTDDDYHVIKNQGTIRCCLDIARHLDINIDNFSK